MVTGKNSFFGMTVCHTLCVISAHECCELVLGKVLGVKQLLLSDMPNSSAFSERIKTIKGIYLKELDYQLFIFRYSDFFKNVNIFPNISTETR